MFLSSITLSFLFFLPKTLLESSIPKTVPKTNEITNAAPQPIMPKAKSLPKSKPIKTFDEPLK